VLKIYGGNDECEQKLTKIYGGEMSANELSVEITQEKDTAVNQVLDNLAAELDFLVDLTVEDRKGLAKMGRKNLDIVERSFQHAEGNSRYLPAYMPFEEFKKDVLLYEWLRKVEKKLDLVSNKLKDTAMLAEAESYQTARLYYKSVKAAADAGDEAAEQISRDLAVHFKTRGSRKDNTPPETPGEQPGTA
jgi:hypothetical protein